MPPERAEWAPLAWEVKVNVRRVAAAAALAAGASALVPLGATPAGAVSEPEVVAEGLDHPYKLAFDEEGHLYVAEAGTAGDACIEVPAEDPEGEPSERCAGTTGAVTRVDLSGDEPTQERILEGLSSAGGPEGEVVGPQGIAVGPDGTVYVALGLGGDTEIREQLGAAATQLGTVVALAPDDGAAPEILADIAAFEEAEDPDAGQPGVEGPDSNPFDVELTPEGLLVADAGGNAVLSVATDDGEVALEALLPFGEAPAPPFIPAPPGTMLPVQPVPTAISIGARGTLVGHLTGFPFPVGGSSVLELADGELTAVEEGFTNVVDIAQAPDGTLYVLEFATNGLLAEDGVSRLVQVRTDGSRKVLLQDELVAPSAVAVDADGMVYVSNKSQLPAGEGEIIRVDPTVARDAATASACDPTLVLGAGFGDVGGDVHRESIDCLAWWGLIKGVGEGEFAPNQPVTRGQVATILLGVAEAAGVEIPADPADAFDDDEGNVHEGSIDALAALGIVQGTGARQFSPNAEVSRGQLATMLATAYEAIAGEPLPAGEDAFDDDDTSVHQDNINAVAAAGWITGKSAGTFAPSDPTTRAQLSSLVARMLSTLVDEGFAELPAAG